MKEYSVAIVGASGAVGTEFIQLLARRSFPLKSLRLLASERSAGRTLEFRGDLLPLEVLTNDAFENCDIAFFSAGASRSKLFAQSAVDAGALVIDNSSAFRMAPRVPLVIPEVNSADIMSHQGIIANPNCSTIVLLMAIAPLLTLGKIRRVVVSTYQAASGAGAAAMQELVEQSRCVLDEQPVIPRIFPHPVAFNLFSHNTRIDEDGYNEEERKMINETRKILHNPDIRVTATCIRVPVLRAHSESINVEFEHSRPSIPDVLTALRSFPGVRVVDDAEGNHYPMPIEATGCDEVLVGRVRADLSNDNAIDMFACGDQILKGAALNGFQIAVEWVRRTNAVHAA